MKQLICLLLTCSLAFCGSSCDWSRQNRTPIPVYSTNVLATIDGMPLPCYSIDGKTAIVLEDLIPYGFTVDYNDSARTLDVRATRKPDAPILPDVRRGEENQKLGEVQDSNITARVNSVKITSYSFNNLTCAAIEDLGQLTAPYNQEWGYSDYNMKYSWDEASQTIALQCFRFPVDDWGKLFQEMEALVTETEVSLYTEGEMNEAPFFGGKLEPYSGIYAGINADGNGWPDGSGRIFPHPFAVYSNYMEFDERQERFYKPGSLILPDADALSLVPWNLSDVTQVFENEDYIRRTLDHMASYQKPIIVRFGGEMNIGTLGDSPSAYVKAFRKIADMVHEYPNFATMWSPNDLGSLDRPMSYYYPGDDYVDWIGVSSFMKRDFLDNPNTTRTDAVFFMTGDFAWHTNTLKPVLKFMEEHNIEKPIAISEGAVISALSYSQDDLTDWAEPRLRAMYWNVAMRYPQVKMITYWNNTFEEEAVHYDLTNHPNYISIVEDALQNGPFLLSYSQKARFNFVKPEGRSFEASAVPLYTYAYLPEEMAANVQYQINGTELSTQTEIPYHLTADLSGLEDGTHTLNIVVNGTRTVQTRSYPFVKQGGSIRFEG